MCVCVCVTPIINLRLVDILLVHAIGKGSRGGLVDHTDNVQPGNLTGITSGLLN